MLHTFFTECLAGYFPQSVNPPPTAQPDVQRLSLHAYALICCLGCSIECANFARKKGSKVETSTTHKRWYLKQAFGVPPSCQTIQSIFFCLWLRYGNQWKPYHNKLKAPQKKCTSAACFVDTEHPKRSKRFLPKIADL